MSAYPVFRLGDIANVVAGDPAPQEPRAFAPAGPLFVRMQDVGLHHVNPVLADTTDRLSLDWLAGNRLRLFPKDSILIPKSGASVNLNHRAKLATDAHVVSHLAVVMPDKSRIDPDYLFWWSVRYDPRAQAQVTSLPSLKLSTLKEAKVPLPPLDEQRWIVGILNRAAKIERLRARARALMGEFMPALFIKMFGDPVENLRGWDVALLGEVIQGFEVGKNVMAGNGTTPLRILKVSAVTSGEFDPSMSKPAPDDYPPVGAVVLALVLDTSRDRPTHLFGSCLSASLACYQFTRFIIGSLTFTLLPEPSPLPRDARSFACPRGVRFTLSGSGYIVGVASNIAVASNARTPRLPPKERRVLS